MADFDRIAACYAFLEAVCFSGKLQRCRLAFLREIPAAGRVLVAGEGPGRFLSALVRQDKDFAITCVDASAAMLETCRRRLQREGLSIHKVEFVQADLRSWQPIGRSYDVIATHFCLDCLGGEDLDRSVRNLARLAHASTLWLVSDFQIPEGGPARWRARAIHWMMYRFFWLVSGLSISVLESPDPLLARQGFVLQKRRVFDWGLLYGALWRAEPLPISLRS